jgi:hypothetical protein
MKIVYNGREYQSLDQMPPEEREEYDALMKLMGGDANANGAPDALERANSESLVVDESIEYNGKVYKSLSELPPEVRELLDRMPRPNPGDIKSSVEVRTVRTKVLPPRVKIIHGDLPGIPSEREEIIVQEHSNPAFPWTLVVILTALLIAVLCFWLLGVKPSALWRR